jgi:hypothetical protein
VEITHFSYKAMYIEALQDKTFSLLDYESYVKIIEMSWPDFNEDNNINFNLNWSSLQNLHQQSIYMSGDTFDRGSLWS